MLAKRETGPLMMSPVTNFDDVVIRPAPVKPFEIADSPEKFGDEMTPCVYCKRSFSLKNYARHVVICEKLAQKPKREAFQAVAQRLAHVAQEDAVRPIMQKVKQRSADGSDEGQDENQLGKKVTASKKKITNARVGGGIFKELQKEGNRCQYCERSFSENAFERHLSFCREQAEKKHRHPQKEDPNHFLLQKRVKYRPPLPKSNKKNSDSELYLSDSKASRPRDLTVHQAKLSDPSSDSAVKNLTQKLAAFTLGSRTDPSPQERRSPSDYGSGESVLSRSESSALQDFSTASTPLHQSKGNLIKSRPVDNLSSPGETLTLAARKIAVASSAFKTPIAEPTKSRVMDNSSLRVQLHPTTTAPSHKQSDSALLSSASHGNNRPEKQLGKKEVTTTSLENLPYPFNVAVAQKEELMRLHRSNSMRAKLSAGSTSSSGSSNWESIMKPVTTDRYPPSTASPAGLPRNVGLFSTPDGRKNGLVRNEPSSASKILSASLYATIRTPVREKQLFGVVEDELESPRSSDVHSSLKSTPIGSSASIKSSLLGSVTSTESTIRNGVAAMQSSRYCHNCGSEFPVATAHFCCHCGMARLKLSS